MRIAKVLFRLSVVGLVAIAFSMAQRDVLASGCSYNPAGDSSTNPKYYYHCDIGPLEGCAEYQVCSIFCGLPDGASASCGAVGTHTCNPSCSSPSCFLPGTKISTPDGDRNIEDLKPGDKVLSFDEETGRTIENTVEDLIVSQRDEYYVIKTASGKEIGATAEHPFYTGETTEQDNPPQTRMQIFWDFIKNIPLYLRLGWQEVF